ncbi:MAG: SH3 domain-containing protein [Hyalangium sp.]|uniref:SH3 domain-containing protein n=1 Tax=Hyalangium sp. TaxID=2028555 RepID=UPI00389AAFDF
MHKRARRLVTVLAWCAASTALAAGASEPTLYVKARNTRLMASASPTAEVLTILQPGQKVIWKGADSKNKQWHHVVVDGKEGLVFQSNLAKQPPSMELVAKDGTRTSDNRGLISSGAAIRGLADGATQYGREKGKQVPSFSDSVDQIKELEKLARTITPEELAAHVDKAHLFPVVGPQADASPGDKR